MKYQSLTSTAMCMLFSFVSSIEVSEFSGVTTKTFGSHNFHEKTSLSINSKAGLGTGFGVFGVLFLFAIVYVFIDHVQRNKDLNRKLVEARKRMEEIDINVADVDRDYEELHKN